MAWGGSGGHIRSSIKVKVHEYGLTDLEAFTLLYDRGAADCLDDDIPARLPDGEDAIVSLDELELRSISAADFSSRVLSEFGALKALLVEKAPLRKKRGKILNEMERVRRALNFLNENLSVQEKSVAKPLKKFLLQEIKDLKKTF